MTENEKIKQIIKGYEPQIFGGRTDTAVLLPLIKVADEWHVLYEVRSQVVSQAGDSSFPGGKVEPGESFEEAAVRETMEELNLERENIKVYGEMDFIISQYITIHCFVGEIVGVKVEDIQPNIEVEQIYTIPLSYLLNNAPSYFGVSFDPILDEQFIETQENKFELRNQKEYIPYYRIDNHMLWGYTANLTERFIEIIKDKNQ